MGDDEYIFDGVKLRASTLFLCVMEQQNGLPHFEGFGGQVATHVIR